MRVDRLVDRFADLLVRRGALVLILGLEPRLEGGGALLLVGRRTLFLVDSLVFGHVLCVVDCLACDVPCLATTTGSLATAVAATTALAAEEDGLAQADCERE